MFLLDDILAAPMQGLMYIFEQIQKKAEEETRDTPEKLKKELLELQGLLDAGRISEEGYFKREKNILERLNSMQK